MYDNLYNTLGMGDCEKACANPGYQCENPSEPTTPEIEKLRRKRDEANNQASAYQKQIDEAIIALHNVPDFDNKWVRLPNRAAKEGEVYDIIIHVTSIERMKYGIRLNSDKRIFVADCEFTCFSLMFEKDSETVNWKDIDNIKVFDDEFVKQYTTDTFEHTLGKLFE